MIRAALDEIAQADERGQLRPEAIVAQARAKDSVLHGCFTWDETRAAEHWRLHEARVLIRTYTVVIEQDPMPVTTRAFVSLKSARINGSGYTPIQRILSDAQLHAEMLGNAFEDLEQMERRYGHLQELRPVFRELRRARARLPRTRSGREAVS
jgi:hypothetical protein